MGIFSCEVNLFVLVFEESTIANTNCFFDFAQDLVRDLLESLSEIFSFKVNLVPLIVTQSKRISITVYTNYTAISAGVVIDVGALL